MEKKRVLEYNGRSLDDKIGVIRDFSDRVVAATFAGNRPSRGSGDRPVILVTTSKQSSSLRFAFQEARGLL